MACHAFVRSIMYDELLEKYIMQKDGNKNNYKQYYVILN